LGQRNGRFQPRHIDDFPPELLLNIFSFLESDDSALLSAELTCTRWKAQLESGRVYERKCRRMLAGNRQLAATFAQHQFESQGPVL
jgi:hypothetical protein